MVKSTITCIQDLHDIEYPVEWSFVEDDLFEYEGQVYEDLSDAIATYPEFADTPRFRLVLSECDYDYVEDAELIAELTLVRD